MSSKDYMPSKCAAANGTPNDLISIKLDNMYETVMFQILFYIESLITIITLSLLHEIGRGYSRV